MIPLKTNGMSDQVTNNSAALRLFFTDDIYLLKEDIHSSEAVDSKVLQPVQAVAEPMVVAATIPPVIAPPRPVQSASFEYLGKNLRNILILVYDTTNDVSTTEGRELLRNIVKAIGLTANDFALINYAGHQGVTFDQFSASLKSRTLFAFGVTPQQLGLPMVAQHTATQQGSVTMIFSSDLHQLSADQQGKKMLWGSLKQMNL